MNKTFLPDLRDRSIPASKDIQDSRPLNHHSLPPLQGRPCTTSGIEAAVMVIRRMFATGVSPSDKDLRLNPLFGYAVRDFEQGTQEDIKAEQQLLFDSLGEDFGSRSFEDIMSSKVMRDTLWVHPQASLFIPERLRRPCPDGVFTLQHEKDGLDAVKVEVAEESLVLWDGSLPLSEVVQKRFGCHLSDDMEFVTLNNPGPAFWLRVWYTPGEHTKAAADEKHIRELSVRPKYTERNPDGPGFSETMGAIRKYLLSIVVRLRKGPEEEDLCRVYDKSPNISGSTWTNEKWKIGEPGYTYALFYKQKDIPLADIAQEVPKISEEVSRRHEEVDGLLGALESYIHGNPRLDEILDRDNELQRAFEQVEQRSRGKPPSLAPQGPSNGI